MAKFEIEMTEAFKVSVQKGEASVTIDPSKLTAEHVEKLFWLGLKHKIASAATGAKKISEGEDETRSVAEIAADLMAKTVKNLENGEWGIERGASNVDPLDVYRQRVVRGALQKPENEALKKQYTAIPAIEQATRIEFLMKIAEAKADIVDPAAKKLKALDEEKQDEFAIEL